MTVFKLLYAISLLVSELAVPTEIILPAICNLIILYLGYRLVNILLDIFVYMD